MSIKELTVKNNKTFGSSISSHLVLSRNRYIAIVIISCVLMACTTTSYKHNALGGLGFSPSGCAVLRNDSVFSGYRFSNVTSQNARYVTADTFVVRGTQVSIDKVESSWDLENGYRIRLYLRSPMDDVSHTFFLEHSTLNKESLSDFVNSILQPCR